MFDYNTWMTDLPENMRWIPFIFLAIPGTHDSLSFSITHESELAPDAPALAKALYPYFGKYVKRIMYRWSVTQSDNLAKQLSIGIRYFDLRVATKPKDDRIYSCHSLYGCVISDALNEINSFLDRYPKEIVILDFQHFYAFDDKSHKLLISMIISVFRNKICPKVINIRHMNMAWLWYKNYRVIVVYRDKAAVVETPFWPSENFITYWPNTTDVVYLRNFLNFALVVRKKPTGFVSQCVLTPSTTFVLCHLLSNLKDTCCRICNKFMKDNWLLSQKAGMLHGVNVIIADFVTMDDFKFSSIVIQRNYIASCVYYGLDYRR